MFSIGAQVLQLEIVLPGSIAFFGHLALLELEGNQASKKGDVLVFGFMFVRIVFVRTIVVVLLFLLLLPSI